MDYCICIDYRIVFSLRTFACTYRLEQCDRRMGHPVFPKRFYVGYYECAGRSSDASQSLLHSEIIQSRQWNLQDDKVIKKQLKYEFLDTFFSMLVGWAINSAMILLAASTFFSTRTPVGELQQAKELLTPLLGTNASAVFAIALFLAGFLLL